MSGESKSKGSKIPRYVGLQRSTSQIRMVATESKLTKIKERTARIDEKPRYKIDDKSKWWTDEKKKNQIHEKSKYAIGEKPKGQIHEKPKCRTEDRPKSRIDVKPKSVIDEKPKCRRRIMKEETFTKDMKGVKFEPDEDALKSILNNEGIQPIADDRRNTASAAGHRCSVYYQPSQSRMSLIESHAAFQRNMQVYMEKMKMLNSGTPVSNAKKHPVTQASENTGSAVKKPCSIYFSLRGKHEAKTPSKVSNSLQNTPKTEERRAPLYRNCLTEIKENIMHEKPLRDGLESPDKHLDGDLKLRENNAESQGIVKNNKLSHTVNISEVQTPSIRGRNQVSENVNSSVSERGTALSNHFRALTLSSLSEEVDSVVEDNKLLKAQTPTGPSTGFVPHLVWSSQRAVCTPTYSTTTVMSGSGNFFPHQNEFSHHSVATPTQTIFPHKLDFTEMPPASPAVSSSAGNVTPNVLLHQKVVDPTCGGTTEVCRTPVLQHSGLPTITAPTQQGLHGPPSATPTRIQIQTWTPSPAPSRVVVTKAGMGGPPGRTPILSSCLKKKVGQTFHQGTQSTTKKKLRWMDV